MTKPIFDGRMNSTARPVFRVLAGVLGLVMGAGGVLAMQLLFFSDGTATFDSIGKFGIAATFCGILFLIICIRGRITK